jgi:hypothetical protein
MSNVLIATINLLALMFAAMVAAALNQSRAGLGPLLIIALAVVIGLANAFLPPLAALRDQLPLAQPLMVLGMTIGLLAIGLSSAGTAFFRATNVRPLIALHGWRLVFGMLLLVAGLAGALPPSFFWSVAIGDIVAGTWAISIWRRNRLASLTELKLWSALGLADLLHVLPRAALTLPPFYLAHPDLLRPLLLPLLGVPILIALHVVLLRRFIADGKSPEGDAPFQTH